MTDARPLSTTVSVFAALGGMAALLTVLGDYGAHWLWLPLGSDRIRLLSSMLGLQVPLGILLGAAIGAFLALTERTVRDLMPQRDRMLRRFMQLFALAVPGILFVSQLLFTGGLMARLPAQWLLRALAAKLLAIVVGAVLLIAVYLVARAQSRQAQLRLGVAALAVGFALGKIDQQVMPNLYAYLHAVLGVSAWSAYVCGAWLLFGPRIEAQLADMPRLVRLSLLALAPVWLAFTILSLDQNQNVRVALLHPNASTTRSVMLGLGPTVLEPLQRRAIAEARLNARKRAASTAFPGAIRLKEGQGPRLDDAHILLITIDALRPDHLGFHGYPRPTSPKLDALAAQSVVFERAYAAAPHSSYSLSSLMTSEYLHETLELGQPAPTATLATALASVGYHTAAFFTLGVFHTATEKLKIYEQSSFGFALHDHVSYEAEALTDRVLQEVDRTITRGEPSTLLWAHFFDVHEPYEDTHFGHADIDRYDGEIRKADAAVDRLIRETRKRLTRDVVVLISADHGEEFREHGGVYHGSSLYEEQIRVPLLVNAPGLVARRVAAPVETVAIAPTLIELVGGPIPSTMRGDDLRALLVNDATDIGPAFAAVSHKKMVVRFPYKLIADLRFGLFELYDLQRDPRERENLAGAQPVLRDALRDEIYGWLDSLAVAPATKTTHGARPSKSAHQQALDLGKLGDRRAVAPLIALAQDRSASEAERIQACHMLGHLADDTSADALAGLLDAGASAVAAEAAIALGRMFDVRARDALRKIVRAEDPDVRTRAAVSLGRLRDRAAVPALIEALWIAPREYEREEAIRWLGRLGDVQALEALLQILPESRTRHLAVVAIGRLKDARAFAALRDVLARERLENVRSATVQGLGYLGDPRAIELVLPLSAEDAAVATASETLVRLGALTTQAIGGADVQQGGAGMRGFGKCFVGVPLHDWDYVRRTSCTTTATEASLRVEIPRAVAQKASVALVSARRTDSGQPMTLQIWIGKTQLPAIRLDGTWSEARVPLDAGALQAGKTTARIVSDPADARIELDHLLLVPRVPPANGNAPVR